MSGDRGAPVPGPTSDARSAADAGANRAAWAEWADNYVEPGRRAWAAERPPGWGMWHQPEAALRILGESGTLAELDGLDVLDYGCGTGYWSAWLTRAGARVVAFDNSPEQLATCRRFQEEFGLAFPTHQASAGRLDPAVFPDASFDLVFSEYAGMTWADPYRTVPEAARLLRPGGRLVFLKIGVLLEVCWEVGADQASDSLQVPWFGLHRLEDPNDGSVAFDLGTGEWIRLLREHGFRIERLAELQPPADAPPIRHTFVTLDWARKWPAEEVWVARKLGPA